MSVVRVRGFIASVFALIIGVIIIGVALALAGFNIPVISDMVSGARN